MREIEIKYKVIGPFSLKFKRNVPEKWSEITPEQLLNIGLMYTNTVDDAKFLIKFMNLPGWLSSRLDPFYVFCILDGLHFLSDYKPHESFIIKKLINGVPPRPKLVDLTFGRFMFIDTYFNDYAIEGTDEVSLNKFIATLYWPSSRRKNADKYNFDENHIEERAKMAENLDMITKQAIAINYRLVKDWLAQCYPLIFSSSTSSAPERKKESVWLKVHDAIIGDDIINSDRYSRMPLHEVLRYISKKIKEHAKRS